MSAATEAALPPEMAGWPGATVDEATADDLELALDGACPEPSAVQVDRSVDLSAGTVVLHDPEHVPVAALHVTEVLDTPGAPTVGLRGTLQRLRRRERASYPSLWRTPAAARAEAAGGPLLVVATDRPLHRHDVAAVRSLAVAEDADVLLLLLAGAGRPHDVHPLVRAVAAAAEELAAATGRDVRLRLAPVPQHPGLGVLARARLAATVAAAYGASVVLLPHTDGVVEGDLADPAPPVPTRVGPAGPLAPEELLRRLDSGEELPAGYTYPAAERALRAARPPLAERGMVLLFSGLSGSGKSTVAAAVAEQLRQRTDRRLTSLDGDVVRTLLSKGLTFSKEDRDLNVRRIGYVAAEVARHGGTAVCAPIAPYAATRAEVRAMVEAVGELVLVHVSTPLEVCEARDRKGLYAKARAGLIPSFTGISDPYEEPTDADVVIDTSVLSLEECVDRVLRHLGERGLVTPG